MSATYLIMSINTMHGKLLIFGILLVTIDSSISQNVPEFVPGQHLVLWKPNSGDIGILSVADFDAELDKVNMKSIKSLAFKGFGITLLTASSADLAKVRQISEVVAIEPNWKIYAFGTTDDPILTTMEMPDSFECLTQDVLDVWGLDRIDQKSASGSTKQYIYGSTSTGKGVTVYVADSGVNVADPEFEGRASFGFMASDINETTDDLNGHGTHVAGTVGSRTYGVAKSVDIIAVKVLGAKGSGTASGYIEGLKWIVDDYRQKKKPKSVVNLSLGFSGVSPSLDAALKELIDEGITAVVAAGNNGEDACDFTPARLSDAITVGASNILDQAASFSNWGACVDIWAPGQSIMSTWPPNGSNNTIHGTSMACPHVAGAAARYLSSSSAHPSPDEVAHFLTCTATTGALSNLRSGSPNHLLFMDCREVYATPTDCRIVYATTPPASGTSFINSCPLIIMSFATLSKLFMTF